MVALYFARPAWWTMGEQIVRTWSDIAADTLAATQRLCNAQSREIKMLRTERDRLASTLGEIVMLLLQHQCNEAREQAMAIEITMQDGAPFAAMRTALDGVK